MGSLVLGIIVTVIATMLYFKNPTIFVEDYQELNKVQISYPSMLTQRMSSDEKCSEFRKPRKKKMSNCKENTLHNKWHQFSLSKKEL